MQLVRAGTVAALAVLIAACDSTRPIEETAQTFECLRCHGYPPPTAVVPGHPQNPDCSLCHPTTVEADDVTLVPGGTHMNGLVERTGGHAPGYANPAVHGPDAFDFFAGEGTLQCTDCHGAEYDGGIAQRSCTGCHTVAQPAPGFADWLTNCTFCHGTQTPGWTAGQINLAAPPEGVLGETDSSSPRVGAHAAHLEGGDRSNGFACGTCHTVPADLTHITNAVEVTLTASGQLPSPLGTYTAASQSCTTYCHGSTITTPAPAPQWTAGSLDCDACHALPPPSGPTSGGVLTPNAHEFHVGAGAQCATCHVGYTDASVDKATHVNGVKNAVVVPTTGGTLPIDGWDCADCHTALDIPAATHAVPYPTHTTDALAGIGACAGCHGADYEGGLDGLAPACSSCHAGVTPAPGFADWKTNCTFCHGTRTPGASTATALAAPPESVEGGGDQTNANPDVGAHQAHLNPGTYSAGFACTTCHPVPTPELALSHFSGRTTPATVAFDALASQGAGTPTYTGGSCAVYCHGNGTSWPAGSVGADKTPPWTQDAVGCDACHASRPATGAHTSIGGHNAAPCAYCHLDYVQNTTVDPARHVNGTRNVRFINKSGVPVDYTEGWAGGGCTACHNVNGNFNP
jgi:predicted CxxxxCH...CXXCH cytochrome family protein